MRDRLEVALVGFGLAGATFHAPLIASTPGLALRTVVSSDAGKVHAAYPQARVVADAEAAFADPAIDLVVVAAPNDAHAALARAALAAGKHVVVDKPFALDLAQATAVVEQAARARRLVSVFQNRRWDSDFLTLRALIAAGRLGDIAEFHSHFDRYRPQVADRWREHDLPGSGLWFDLGPHLLDQALRLFGPPQAVLADLGRQREGAKADDYFHVLLRYPRLRVHLHAGSLVPGSGLRFAVHGTRASFLKHGMDAQEEALRRGVAPGGAGWGVDPRPGELHIPAAAGALVEKVIGPNGDYGAYYRAVHAAIVRGEPLPVTPAEALEVMALIERAVRSSVERRELQSG
ncbi:MAG TPA: oxidoreductase [Pseudoxanthomonas sp.]|nr:oxidoreductase [Pseudoxanthomonas sp.]